MSAALQSPSRKASRAVEAGFDPLVKESGRVDQRARAEQLLVLDIEYPRSSLTDEPQAGHLPLDLDGTRLLTSAEELSLFRWMNWSKRQADMLRRSLDLDAPSAGLMDEIELLLDGAAKIRNQLVLVFMKLGASVARGFVSAEFPLDELVSEAGATLMRAAEKFDPERGFRFSTYATHAVRRNLTRFVVKRRNEKLRATAIPNTETLLDARRWSWRYERQVDSANQAVREMIDRLDAREQKIVLSRFGLDGELRPQTLQKIAENLGISRERVRQLERRALDKLRQMASHRKLELPHS